MVYIYILKLKSGRLYVGQSTDPRRRFFEHKSGKGANICKSDHPVEILWQGCSGQRDGPFTSALEDWCTVMCKFSFSSSQVSGGRYCHGQYLLVDEDWLIKEACRLMDWMDRLMLGREDKAIELFAEQFNTWRETAELKS